MVAIVEEGLPRGSRHWAVGEAGPGGVEGDSVDGCVGESSIELSVENWVAVTGSWMWTARSVVTKTEEGRDGNFFFPV